MRCTCTQPTAYSSPKALQLQPDRLCSFSIPESGCQPKISRADCLRTQTVDMSDPHACHSYGLAAAACCFFSTPHNMLTSQTRKILSCSAASSAEKRTLPGRSKQGTAHNAQLITQHTRQCTVLQLCSIISDQTDADNWLMSTAAMIEQHTKVMRIQWTSPCITQHSTRQCCTHNAPTPQHAKSYCLPLQNHQVMQASRSITQARLA